ncbi:DUF5689 domain-containing protein [Pedobacter psychroterrae]|uniref:DUF5689 domain-containing protein n=1 Tax=Pedobacter psychroterrae TaxID=2530453 RepID=A0A4R0NTY4_9SPHI|nr:DUF5689 domain-containing protein [Pedobacter psychroterrae]TCD03618.1 hypothetical protein EZ437_06605 [Pedobacter psychroterrae]
MKKIFIYSFFLLGLAFAIAGCKKNNYPGGTISAFIPMYDLRNLYKGADLTLTQDNMFGSNQISGVVISDHPGGNLPEGYLILQDKRRLNELRGIAIPIGAAAKDYVSGDSIHVHIVGGVLKRENGMLQIIGITPDKITKISSGNVIPPNRVPSSFILLDPDKYESTLVAIAKGTFDPLPSPADTYSGAKLINDGFADIPLVTLGAATFANSANLPVVGNFYGIVVNRSLPEGKLTPEIRMRKLSDAVVLSNNIEVAPAVISGWINDPQGTDANNEYIQFLATQDIDFATTPMSVVTSNNAGTAEPTGAPLNGWATGGVRTYKFNITTGTAKKGTYFYVGGTNQLINSTGSTNISTTANFVKTRNYGSSAGESFGNTTTNLLANSGNAYGIALFNGTTVTVTSVPVDVVWVSTGGALYQASPAAGFRVAANDFYDRINPLTLAEQPFFTQGLNTLNFIYAPTSDAGWFYKVSGVYNPDQGKWVKARSHFVFQLEKTSTVETIEGPTERIWYDRATNEEVRRDTVYATSLKKPKI